MALETSKCGNVYKLGFKLIEEYAEQFSTNAELKLELYKAIGRSNNRRLLSAAILCCARD